MVVQCNDKMPGCYKKFDKKRNVTRLSEGFLSLFKNHLITAKQIAGVDFFYHIL